MTDYVYQDNEQTMPSHSAMLTSRIGDGTGDHAAVYLDTINLLASVKSQGSMIDIGCGRGRVSEAVSGRIKEVVALEPDPGRANWSNALLADHPGVSVHQQMTYEYMADNPGKQFDLVVLGMVLQHLSTGNVTKLLDDVVSLTKDGGIAIVSTTHAIETARCFTYQHVSEARLTEEEFNAYAEDSHGQDKGLPVHRFSRSEFETIIPSSFEILQWTQFSYIRHEHLEAFAKVNQVEPEELTNHANSQFVILKKKAS